MIRLTVTDDRTVYLNPTHILYVEQSPNIENQTNIWTVGDEKPFTVKETVKEVLLAIRTSQSYQHNVFPKQTTLQHCNIPQM